MNEVKIIPNYFEHLNEEDKNEYQKLRILLSDPSCKNRRNKSTKTFEDVVIQIKKFVVRNQEDDWKRSYVCGICWLENGIAINVRQLKILISKCKSSINGSFHRLGYEIIQPGAEYITSLISIFPFLKENFPELRKWTIRHIKIV